MWTSIVKPPILGLSDISGLITMKLLKWNLRPHFRWCPGSKFLGTNLDSFEANWILRSWILLLPWAQAFCILVLHMMSSTVFLSAAIDFHSKNGAIVGLDSISHFLGLDPPLSKKLWGPIAGSHPKGLLLYFIGLGTLYPCLKWP
jgi:hypothetical protein